HAPHPQLRQWLVHTPDLLVVALMQHSTAYGWGGEAVAVPGQVGERHGVWATSPASPAPTGSASPTGFTRASTERWQASTDRIGSASPPTSAFGPGTCSRTWRAPSR